MKPVDKITTKQLFAVIFVGLLSPLIRLLPKRSTELAGTASWLAPIAAFVPLLLFGALILFLIKNRSRDEGLANLFIRSLGKYIGGAVCLLFAVWLLFYSGFILRTSGERLLSTVYDNGNITFFLVVTILLALLPARGEVKSLARLAEVFTSVLIVTLAVVFLFSIPGIKIRNLLPVSINDTLPILYSAIPIVDVVSVWIYMTFISGYVEKGDRTAKKKLSIRWLSYTLIIIFLLMVTTVGNFGSGFLTQMQHPFFVMIKNITIFNIVERIESVVIAIWIATDFIFLSALLIIISEILKTVFKAKKRTPFAYPCAAISLIVSLIIAPNAFVLETISEVIVPIIHLALALVVIPLILFIGKIRKKI